jgi:amino acid transporter
VLIAILISASAVESITVILVISFITPLLLLAVLMWSLWWKFKHGRFKKCITVPICLAILLSIVFTHWLLKLHYLLFKPQLNNIADRTEAGRIPAMPVRIGPYNIKRSEVYHNGITCLWTNVHQAGYAGFARCSPEYFDRFNLWSKVNLDDGWQFISED